MPKSGKYYTSTFRFEGKQYKKYGKTQKEADQKAALAKDALMRGETGISGDMTVARWAGEWLEVYKRPVVGEGQYQNYLCYLKTILHEIGSMTLKSVKDIHLQRILNQQTGKSKSYLGKLRMTMAAIFSRAHLSRLIAINPAANLELPVGTEGTRRSLTDYERKMILALADTHYAGLWIKILLFTGLRPGETRALDWRHIDLKKGLIHVKQSMKAGTKEIGAPKSKAGIRDVPIPNHLLSELSEAKKDPFEPVFVQSTTGKRHTKHSMETMWDNFKRHLDISMGAKVYRNKLIISAVASDLSPYILRHTYATDLQDAGVPINVAKYLLGHSSITLTAKIYTHTTETAIKNAAEMINKRYFQG